MKNRQKFFVLYNNVVLLPHSQYQYEEPHRYCKDEHIVVVIMVNHGVLSLYFTFLNVWQKV